LLHFAEYKRKKKLKNLALSIFGYQKNEVVFGFDVGVCCFGGG
jgi:hypothetical protein